MTTRLPTGSDKGILYAMGNTLGNDSQSNILSGDLSKQSRFKLWYLVPIFAASFLVFWFWKPKWVCHLQDGKHHVKFQLVLLWSILATAIISGALWYLV